MHDLTSDEKASSFLQGEKGFGVALLLLLLLFWLIRGLTEGSNGFANCICVFGLPE